MQLSKQTTTPNFSFLDWDNVNIFFSIENSEHFTKQLFTIIKQCLFCIIANSCHYCSDRINFIKSFPSVKQLSWTYLNSNLNSSNGFWVISSYCFLFFIPIGYLGNTPLENPDLFGGDILGIEDPSVSTVWLKL